jgi:hypothetical protein
MRKQNLNVGPVGAALQVTVLVALLFGVAAMFAHSLSRTAIHPASFAGETMPIVQFP